MCGAQRLRGGLLSAQGTCSEKSIPLGLSLPCCCLGVSSPSAALTCTGAEGLFPETLWNTEAVRLLLRGTGKRVGMWASRVQYQPGRSPPSASSLFRQPDPEPHRPQQDPLSEQLPAEYQQPAQWGARRPGQPQHPAATALHLHACATPHPGLQECPSSLPPLPGPGLSLIPGSVHVCPMDLGPGAGPQALFLCGSDRGRLPGGKVAQVLSK